ncbi:MAG: bifunctional UDP-N-acetylmuramoyl-tripeptide:D-alanyl-D-alanine ligase/alanine racemase [Bacteroidales bacterium]|nr:bifunctional UDP-N-acetylmuramoyl-tripeptide:D-alanyl-D-alanine ligase/alanine racemase [Bacteroidales bacterium]MCF8455137.1 bifunctional UDP-N-acetylmuramoyl-tripeptide:D-alanyl-D-alanine ligase/alanine racemase [Bacteroidales bacterium]
MPTYPLKRIAEVVNAEYVDEANPDIRYLVTDSRGFISPDGTLYFALKGLRHDGHNFIGEMYDKGVRSFVISNPEINTHQFADASFLLVKDTLIALQKLAANHRKQFNIPVVGITGSNGKTIIKEWLFQLMENKQNLVRSPKSYNSQIGVPLSVWLLEPEHEMAVFEAGISEVGEMQKLAAIIAPTIGIFSNIGDAHQQNFIDYKHKISEKLKLFQNTEILIYCKDYNLIENQIKTNDKFEDTQLFSWSRKFPADLFVSKVEKGSKSTRLEAKFQTRPIDIEIPFIDDASIENAIHCWAFMLLAYENEEIKERMLTLVPVAMRLELKQGINNCTIINDSYNSDIGSLSIALDFLNQQNQHKQKTLVISDILQSGKDETGLYKEVADLVFNKHVSRLIGIGEAISRNERFFKTPSQFYKNTEDFLQSVDKDNFMDEAILLKGSRTFEFELISNSLQHKTHRTVLEINLNALAHNLNYFRAKLNKGTKVMAMVKAFSYGSGTFEVANILQYQKVDYLGVAFADEGVALRKAGIVTPIMVMNPDQQSFESIIEYILEPEIYNLKMLEEFSLTVKRFSVGAYPVHIKLETGMNRLGFSKEDLPALLKGISNHPNLLVKSIFSHNAASDDAQHDDFTHQQFALFDSMSKKIMNELNYPVLRHILNSPGIERFPDYQLDMVRLGIGMYGVSSESNGELQNVSTLKTRISQIKSVAAGESVGYSRACTLERDSKIAILPIGYSDGLRRIMGNGKGKVCISDKLVPIIGNICMDMCTVDVTDISVEEEDEVIIFGEKYPISEMARTLETIPYEVMTGISSRVKRVYLYE